MSADSDGPVEWCKPVPQAEAHALAEHYPELTLRTEPAHREAFVALPDWSGPDSAVHWQLAIESLEAWVQEQEREHDDESVLPSRTKTSACASPISRPDPSPPPTATSPSRSP